MSLSVGPARKSESVLSLQFGRRASITLCRRETQVTLPRAELIRRQLETTQPPTIQEASFVFEGDTLKIHIVFENLPDPSMPNTYIKITFEGDSILPSICLKIEEKEEKKGAIKTDNGSSRGYVGYSSEHRTTTIDYTLNINHIRFLRLLHLRGGFDLATLQTIKIEVGRFEGNFKKGRLTGGTGLPFVFAGTTYSQPVGGWV